MRNLKQLSTSASIIVAFTMIIGFSCNSTSNTQEAPSLLIEVVSDSTNLSMQLSLNKLGAFNYGGKFVGVVPAKLQEDAQSEKIELYFVDSPNFAFEEFIENIQKGKTSTYSKREVSSFDELTRELNNTNTVEFSASRGSNINAAKAKMTLTNGSTSVDCTCPCSATINGRTATCK